MKVQVKQKVSNIKKRNKNQFLKKKWSFKKGFLRKKYKTLNTYKFLWFKQKGFMGWSIRKFYKKLSILTKFFKDFVYVEPNQRKKKWKKTIQAKFPKITALNIFSFMWYLEHRLDCILVNYMYSDNLRKASYLIKKGYIYLNFKKETNPQKVVQMGSILQFSFFFHFKDKILRIFSSPTLQLPPINFVITKAVLVKRFYKKRFKKTYITRWWEPALLKKYNIPNNFVEENKKIQSIIFLQNSLLKNKKPFKNEGYCFGRNCFKNKQYCCFKKGIKIKTVPFFILYEQRFFF